MFNWLFGGNSKKIDSANTESFPYWFNPGFQNPNLLPGRLIAGEIQDINGNRIPSETDFNHSDINLFVSPKVTAQDTENVQGLEAPTPDVGRGAAVSLVDMFNQSMDEVKRIGVNQ